MPRRRQARWWHCVRCGANSHSVWAHPCIYCRSLWWIPFPSPKPEHTGQQTMWMLGRVDGDLVHPDTKSERMYAVNQLLILADGLRGGDTDAEILERSRRREKVLTERGIDPNPSNYRHVPHPVYVGTGLPSRNKVSAR